MNTHALRARLWLALTLGVGVASASCAHGPAMQHDAGSSRSAGASAIAAAQALFDAMREKDEAVLRAVLADELAITSLSSAGEPQTILGGPDAFIRSVMGASEVFDERIVGEALVRVDGRLAIVWAPYTFHRGATFSHCGYDALHLARELSSDQWRIVAIAYTRRFGNECDDIIAPEAR